MRLLITVFLSEYWKVTSSLTLHLPLTHTNFFFTVSNVLRGQVPNDSQMGVIVISFRCSNSKFIFSLLHYLPTTFTFYCHYPVADPDLQLRRGGRGWFCFACHAGFSSFCDFTRVKGGPGHRGHYPRSAIATFTGELDRTKPFTETEINLNEFLFSLLYKHSLTNEINTTNIKFPKS